MAMVTRDGNGTVGGITAGHQWPFWKNQFQTVARATGLQYPALKAAMNALWMKLVRGTEHPDLIVADGEIYAHLRERPAGEPALLPTPARLRSASRR